MVEAVAACRTPESGPYLPPDQESRETSRAEAMTREAADLIQSNPVRAEALLREALTADLFHGPAHNNLGVVFLGQGKLDEAAHEFEWARKLLPGHPDPRLNLALTLDRAGKLDDAYDAYEAALDVAPGYVPALQGLARLVVRSGRDEGRIAPWLERIAMEGESDEWRGWAREQLAGRSASDR